MTPLKINSNEFIYQKGEFPNYCNLIILIIKLNKVYFLISGRINFIAGNYEIAFKAFISGTYFGEIEIFN